MTKRRNTLVGLGIGLAAAGATAAVGVAADRLVRARSTAEALDTLDSYEQQADAELVVMTDDGVVLHVEVDEPGGPLVGLPDGVEAPTVVLTHGYCLSLRSWVFQRRALTAAGYRVVLWDQRGHGRSGPGAKDTYEIDQLGRDLGRVLADVVPDGPLVLIGHSMGGMTQMAFAVDHHAVIRERVVGAAFVSTSPGGLAAVSWGLGSVLGRFVHVLGPSVTGQLASREGLVNVARRAGSEVELFLVSRYAFASPVPMSIVKLTAEMIGGTRMEIISQFLPAFDRHDKREALAQFVGVETLVLNGVQDVLTPPDHSEEIVRLIPGAEHIIVNDAGHVIMLEHPEIVTEQLLAMLERALRAAAEHRGADTVKTGARRTLTDLAKQRRIASAARSRKPRSRPIRRGRAS